MHPKIIKMKPGTDNRSPLKSEYATGREEKSICFETLQFCPRLLGRDEMLRKWITSHCLP
jgi:hypothetical protein